MVQSRRSQISLIRVPCWCHSCAACKPWEMCCSNKKEGTCISDTSMLIAKANADCLPKMYKSPSQPGAAMLLQHLLERVYSLYFSRKNMRSTKYVLGKPDLLKTLMSCKIAIKALLESPSIMNNECLVNSRKNSAKPADFHDILA